MFVIASSGRCATLALCEGLDRYSDHRVEHEPAPRLLEEAHRKHHGRNYRTPALARRLEFFRKRARETYGQSFRAAPLLPELREAAPTASFLVLVREPLGYVVSANAKRVLRRGDEWDRSRILPLEDPRPRPLAEQLALHWVEVNHYLLDFAETDRFTRVAVLGRLERDVDAWVEFLGVRITDRRGLEDLLSSNRNASARSAVDDGFSDGYEPTRLTELCEPTWARGLQLASRSW